MVLDPVGGVCDNLFVLNTILNNRFEFRQSTHLLFIDFKSAFDSCNRESLWETLYFFNVPANLIMAARLLVEIIYSNKIIKPRNPLLS